MGSAQEDYPRYLLDTLSTRAMAFILLANGCLLAAGWLASWIEVAVGLALNSVC